MATSTTVASPSATMGRHCSVESKQVPRES